MLITSIDQLDHYAHLHPGFKKAGKFLMRADLATLADGRHEVDGAAVFALVSRCEGKGRGARLEAHRNYIDVQYCVSGKEIIGFRALAQCNTVSAPYDEANDVVFFEDSVREWINLEGYDCAVFFPDDAHAPLAGDGTCKKIVVKVRV
jgi:biofilm protein TabA